MTSIWENDFYDTPPQPLYAFESVWDQYTELTTDAAAVLSKACTNIQVAAREIQMPPVYYGGLEFRYPARANNAGELTVTFAEVNTMLITSILNDLFDRKSYNQQWANSNGISGIYYRDSYNKQANKIIVKVLKPDSNYMYITDGGEYSKKFIFNNCTLIKIEGIEFDAASEEVVNISATFSFDFMTTETGATEIEQDSLENAAETKTVDSDGNLSQSKLKEFASKLTANEKKDLGDVNINPAIAQPDTTSTKFNNGEMATFLNNHNIQNLK